ncbi:hypothetical protein [Sporolactobacillus inulinus]|uniref:Uncharacterized protein n=1 Tax=Sporolactobacillus inulinus CASD TaxID=1069536 RepID=A0A0U1QQM2_9BACL|nr:hypothetical protein [Sporolactobacillus inulinus]KLI02926.1 hypothetical protein SINU_05220 [Sporolactobacillus inulinus CASD]GEB76623.1 hypothetical protein SIN01_09680 [Sporolactobacillus inulinus]
MEKIIMFTNSMTVVAFFVVIGLVLSVAKEGKDERAVIMAYRLFRFLFVFLCGLLSLIILLTSWRTLDYVTLRVCLTTSMSLTVLAGFVYWLIIRKKY